MFQVYQEFDVRSLAQAMFWNDHEQSAWVLGLRAMARGADSTQYRSAENLGETSPRNDCAAWLHWFEDQIEKAYEASGGDLEIIADILERDFETPGCFANATSLSVQAGVFGDGPFIAGDNRQHLVFYLERLAIRMGLHCPDMIASAAVSVIERTIEWARANGKSSAAQTARLLFQCLQNAERVD